MNELQIVVDIKPSLISSNFNEIKSSLSEQMQVYKELEVTEANKVECKKDVATLRKMAKAVNDKKVEVKNEFMKPYTEFEENVKQLIEIINEPIGIIDNQVKEFEEKQRLQKQEAIRDLFCELIETYSIAMQNEIGLNTIYDNRWENATASMKSVKDEMTAKLNTIRDNVALISSMVSDKTEEALRLFWGDLDVAKAMNMINRYEAQKREIEARMKVQQEAEKQRELERERERVREEERKRIREEEWIREEERRKAAEAEEAARVEERAKALAEEERIREEERIATEKRLMGIKESAPVDDDLEAPFDTNEQPFIVPEDITITTNFTVSGNPFELAQVEMYLNSIGLVWERKDF